MKTAKELIEDRVNEAKDWWTGGNELLQKLAGQEYQAQLKKHLKKRAKSTFKFSPPDWLDQGVELLGKNDEEGFKALRLNLLDRGIWK